MRFICLTPLALSTFAYANVNSPTLPSLDLEVLMATDVQVTAPMKRLQSTSQTAASIYVLTQNELVNSGVTSIPQALTLVPGLQVRKIDNNSWAITARGIAGRYSSKLLVMINGQSFHNPGFAGINWESLNVPIFDIERIEVVRGQSGLLWGSNATSGVINIITKHSEDTRSTKFQIESGSNIDHKVVGRFGSDLGTYGAYRVYALNKKSDASSRALVGEPSDTGETTSVGTRADLIFNDDMSLVVQADYTNVHNGQPAKLPDPITNIGSPQKATFKRDDFNIMTKFDHRINDDSNQMVQLSYNHMFGESAYNKETFDIIDVDYQMNTAVNSVRLDWGLNYRFNKIGNNKTEYFTPIEEYKNTSQYGAFVQAQFEIIPDELKFSLGNRAEYNDFTGWEHQPIARATWQLSNEHTLWTSISQGVRIPSLLEQNGNLVLTGFNVGKNVSTGIPNIDELYLAQRLNGNKDVDAEKIVSAEIGYRFMKSNWNFDVSVFQTNSKNALALETEVSPLKVEEILALGDPIQIAGALHNTLVTQKFVSNAELDTYGGEAVLAWQPNAKLKTEIGYSFTSFEYTLQDGTNAAIGRDSDLSQLFLKARASITDRHYVFVLYRLEDGEAYRTSDFGSLDLSWSWVFDPHMVLTVTGNNLLAGEHLEYKNTGEVFSIPTYIDSSVVARLNIDF